MADTAIPWYARKSTRETIGKNIVYIVLVALSLVVSMPFFWIISSSLKSEAEIFLFPPKWIPSRFLWRNYPEALTSFAFGRALKNTITITGTVIVGRLLSTSLAAFAFARLRFPLRNTLFMLVISTMMLPYQVTLIPSFILFYKLGWIDSFRPLTIPAFLGAAPFHIFLLRQFFLSVPMELDEAARLDGCSTWQIYWRIILPLSKPALATVIIFTFLEQWNDFLGPLIYLNSPEKHTLSIALNYFRTGAAYGPSKTWAHLMVVSLVVMTPCLLVFFFAQKYFIQGVVITGLKG